MNALNIHTRLGEIVKAALEADIALAHKSQRQLDVSLAVILGHLQGIHAELKSPQADENSARVREQNTNLSGERS